MRTGSRRRPPATRGRAARAGRGPRARARADPARADARLAVRVLPRRGRADGRRPRRTPQSGLTVQLCGDAHLSNFGGFAAPDRELVFDINDFDETARGPWEWDVKRLAASIAVAGRELGLRRPARRDAVEAAVRSYREAMRQFADDAQPRALVRPARRRAHPQPRRRPGHPRRSATRSSGGSRARGPRTTCAPCRSSPSASTARRASSAARRGSSRSRSCSPARESRSRSLPSSATTAAACRSTGDTCSRATATRTWPAGSAGSAASAPAPGSSC